MTTEDLWLQGGGLVTGLIFGVVVQRQRVGCFPEQFRKFCHHCNYTGSNYEYQYPACDLAGMVSRWSAGGHRFRQGDSGNLTG